MPAHGDQRGKPDHRWDRFIDGVTLLWLGVFLANLVTSLGAIAVVILLSLMVIYVADLVVQYRRVGRISLFLRKHWLTILMIIPYVRVLRLVRLVRAMRTLRVLRLMRIGRWPGIQKVGGATRKFARLRGTLR